MKRITKHVPVGAALALALALGVAAPTGPTRADEPAPEEAGEGKDWKNHMGDLPFLIGREAGDAEAEFTGKPPMYFFTTTW